ncbi:MAG: hypothetical protein N2486_04940 [Caloramator sp.]|nr:hypothetical protein [Caloramator sp.]
MLTKNAQEFRNFLRSQNIELKFFEGDNGDTIVETVQNLNSGLKLRMVIIFGVDEDIVSIYGLDFVSAINPARKNYIYEFINELNKKYTYYKYVFDKDTLRIESHAVFSDNFNPYVVMTQIIGMMRLVESDYPELMRVIWA